VQIFLFVSQINENEQVQIAEQEILRAVTSLVQCCAIKNVIVASHLYDVADVQFTV